MVTQATIVKVQKTEDFKDFAPAKRPNHPNNKIAGKWEGFEHSRLHRLILILLL